MGAKKRTAVSVVEAIVTPETVTPETPWDKVWNPWRGCSGAGTRGCLRCTGARDAARVGPVSTKEAPVPEAIVERKSRGLAVWTGRYAAGEAPPARGRSVVYVGEQMDLFDPSIRDEERLRVFKLMAAAPETTFVVSTRHPAAARIYLSRTDPATLGQPRRGSAPAQVPVWPLENLWLGVSIETPSETDAASEILRALAAHRFLVLAPLLKGVSLAPWLRCPACSGRELMARCPTCAGTGKMPTRSFEWVYLSGEVSDRRSTARRLDPAWVHEVAADAAAGQVPLWIASLGTVWAAEQKAVAVAGDDPLEWPEPLRLRQRPAAWPGRTP